MYQIVGIEKKNYKFDDGKTCDGLNLYLTQERNSVDGYVCERVFVSEKKLGNYNPKLGDRIDVLYNRFGKVQEVRSL